jgi:hypothetical protein
LGTVIRDPDEVIFRSIAEGWIQWWMMQTNLILPVSDHWAALPVPEPSPIVALRSGVVSLTGAILARNRRPLLFVVTCLSLASQWQEYYDAIKSTIQHP